MANDFTVERYVGALGVVHSWTGRREVKQIMLVKLH